MRRSLLFAILVVLLVMVVNDLAWAQKQAVKPLQPPQPAQIASLDQIVSMIVQGRTYKEIQPFWRQILTANPRMDPKTAINYINTQARQKLEANITRVKSQLKSSPDDKSYNVEELQKQYQDYQQAVSSISDIVKQCEDDAMSIIGNLKD